MRLIRFAAPAALVLLPALAFAQASSAPLSAEDARHLLVRTGFAALPREIAQYEGLTRAEAVRRIIDGVRTEPVTPPPDWTKERTIPRPPGRSASLEERRAFQQQRIRQSLQLVAWWYREMTATPSPLTERMTLFWHNHFTSAFGKVRAPILMYRQNLTLRRHALGTFRKFVHAMAADPAMIVYLDNRQNRRGKPNENFARELLELFMLGEGQGYTEADIKEAARAFTGWSIERDSGEYRFRPGVHDGGEKTFMGRTGRFNGTEIIEIVLTKARVAEYITEKAWREFISENPDPAEVKRIADKFRADYDIKVLVGELLLSPHFWAAENRGRLVRSPVELIVGTLRQFELPLPDDRSLALLSRALGQQPFGPPNVKGWPGGTAWIDANTLLLRQQLLRHLMTRAVPGDERDSADREMGDKPPAMKDDKRGRRLRRAIERRMARRIEGVDLDAWYAKLDRSWQSPERLAALLLPIKPVNPPKPGSDPARLVRDLALDPAYQLK